MPAHQHKRKTPKTTIPIFNYRPPSNRYSKERRPSSTTEVPLLLNSRAPSAGLLGRGCRVDATLWCLRGVYWCFYVKVVCKHNTIGVVGLIDKRMW